VRTFEFYIEDERYSVSTLEVLLVEDEARARVLAERRLNDSPTHVAVTVRENNHVLFVLARSQSGA
jgi:hypothetical protein